jgi:hypothetical protein
MKLPLFACSALLATASLFENDARAIDTGYSWGDGCEIEKDFGTSPPDFDKDMSRAECHEANQKLASPEGRAQLLQACMQVIRSSKPPVSTFCEKEARGRPDEFARLLPAHTQAGRSTTGDLQALLQASIDAYKEGVKTLADRRKQLCEEKTKMAEAVNQVNASSSQNVGACNLGGLVDTLAAAESQVSRYASDVDGAYSRFYQDYIQGKNWKLGQAVEKAPFPFLVSSQKSAVLKEVKRNLVGADRYKSGDPGVYEKMNGAYRKERDDYSDYAMRLRANRTCAKLLSDSCGRN